MIPVNFTKNILAPATPVNPTIDSLALTRWAAFGSLSPLRSDSLHPVVLSKNPLGVQTKNPRNAHNPEWRLTQWRWKPYSSLSASLLNGD